MTSARTSTQPDDDPAPDGPFLPGDRVDVDARMPTGDKLIGTGTAVRWLPRDNGLSHGEGVIVTMDEDEGVEPWSYRGRKCFVNRSDCDLLANGEPASAEKD